MAATTQGPRRSTPLPRGPERPGVDRTCRSAAAAEGSVGNRADGSGPRPGVCPGARPDPGPCDPGRCDPGHCDHVAHGPDEDLPVVSPADADRCVLRLVATRRCGPGRSELRRCGIHPTNVNHHLATLRRGMRHAQPHRLVTRPGARRCPAYRRSAVLLRPNRMTGCRMTGCRMTGCRKSGAPKTEHRLSVTPPRTLRMAIGSLNASPGSLYCAAADQHHRRSRVAAGAVGRWRGWASGPLQQRRRLEREWPRYRTQRGGRHGRRDGKTVKGRRSRASPSRNPAASYSPRDERPKYHRRWRA